MSGRIWSVPTLNIKDPEVYRLASALAATRGTSMTAAVRDALVEALARRESEVEARVARMREVARRAAEFVEPPGAYTITDDDLYDEDGLPR